MKHVCVVSPAAGAMGLYPNRVENGRQWFEQQGLQLSFAPNAMKHAGYVSSTVADRLEDLHDGFRSADVVLASIGGYNSSQLLSGMDYTLYSKDKALCGYSDITALLIAVYAKTGNIVFHGPTFLPELCEYPCPFHYTWHCFRQVVLERSPITYRPPTYRVGPSIDWAAQENKMVARERFSWKVGWDVVKTGTGTGKLVGGNLDTLVHILGTEFCPYEIFDRALLFLEQTEYNPPRFDAFLTGLALRGIFNRISGLVIGTFGMEHDNTIINKIVRAQLERFDFPIISNVDLGHTDPMITLPIGAVACLDAKNESQIRLSVMEY